jgi:hypothetical protein
MLHDIATLARVGAKVLRPGDMRQQAAATNATKH